ncbi:MAG: hybrid sensor histidine kinase/response regulator [Lachnospiraceae bacterium]|nr:hybrid sensor histidine kinase/response regulator [Lachnospiraceae bacterium]MEE1255433.1 hybrid sensor histidine kinase/response regulator [Lachnospiraceae bacterium]
MIIVLENEEERFREMMDKDRTIVQTMKGLVSFPMAEAEELIDMERNLKSAQRIISHMGSQINDLLEYTKMEKGIIKPKMQPFRKDEFCKQIEYLLQPMCEDKNLTYEIDLSRTSDVTIKTDKGMLVRLFWQLLDNAAQYSDEGSKIVFKAYTKTLTKREVTTCFVVEDQGVGMRKQFLECVFEPFVREKNKLSDLVDGTGLGLYIVRQLVKLMHGEIQIESEEDKGTRVTVQLTFPICKNNHKGKSELQEDLEIFKGKRAILCEENPKNEAETRRRLERAGMVVEVVERGREIIELFKKSTPYYYDVILINVRMSGMNGFEITNGIRQLDRNDAYLIPIIALIMDTYDENIATPIAGGMDAQIEEPIDLRELAKPLRKFWEKYKE